MDKIARELLKLAKELTSRSKWDTSVSNVFTHGGMMSGMTELRDTLYDMWQSGEISERDFQKGRDQLFKDVEKVRNNIEKFTR